MDCLSLIIFVSEFLKFSQFMFKDSIINRVLSLKLLVKFIFKLVIVYEAKYIFN